jgi:predicted small lipoprotein YifL
MLPRRAMGPTKRRMPSAMSRCALAVLVSLGVAPALAACGGNGPARAPAARTSQAPAANNNSQAVANAENEGRLQREIVSDFTKQLHAVAMPHGVGGQYGFPLPGHPCHPVLQHLLQCPCEIAQILVSAALVADYRENGETVADPAEDTGVIVGTPEEEVTKHAACLKAASRVMQGVS